MTPAQMQELKNFIEARSQAYALWVHRQLRKDLSAVVKAYALDIKNYERQTDAADAQRAAAAVWATAPDNLVSDPKPAPDPEPEPEPGTEPYLLLPEPDPMPTVDTAPEAETAPDGQPSTDGHPSTDGQPEAGANPEPNPAPQQ